MRSAWLRLVQDDSSWCRLAQPEPGARGAAHAHGALSVDMADLDAALAATELTDEDLVS
mgnify:CR=1 FL=1